MTSIDPAVPMNSIAHVVSMTSIAPVAPAPEVPMVVEEMIVEEEVKSSTEYQEHQGSGNDFAGGRTMTELIEQLKANCYSSNNNKWFEIIIHVIKEQCDYTAATYKD